MMHLFRILSQLKLACKRMSFFVKFSEFCMKFTDLSFHHVHVRLVGKQQILTIFPQLLILTVEQTLSRSSLLNFLNTNIKNQWCWSNLKSTNRIQIVHLFSERPHVVSWRRRPLWRTRIRDSGQIRNYWNEEHRIWRARTKTWIAVFGGSHLNCHDN